MKSASPAWFLAVLLLTGCIALPIPHRYTAAPEVRGRLLSAKAAHSPTILQYEIWQSPGWPQRGVTTTYAGGWFVIPEKREWSFLFLIPLAPMDPIWSAEIRLHDDGIGEYKGNTGLRRLTDLNRKHLLPIHLGPIELKSPGGPAPAD